MNKDFSQALERLVWRYEVDAAHAAAFEAAYGAGGDWDRFFSGATGYLGTEFYRELSSPHVYVTIDYWQRPGQRDAYVASKRAAYEAIDGRCEGLTRSERRIA